VENNMEEPLIEILLTKSQIELLLAIDVLDLEYEKILKLPIRKGDKNIINLEPYELEEFCGTVAFTANHENDKKLKRQYNQLFIYLNDYLEKYHREYGDE
jgi:hypothetical protein